MFGKLRDWIDGKRAERSFRRVTRALEAGMPLSEALKLSGEKDPAILDMYRQLLESKGFRQ